jgi:hypothetical protein
MPVTRCATCKRGDAGYLDSEKEVHELSLAEIRTERAKYQAKLARIRQYIKDVKAGTVTPATFRAGRACPDCAHGWREFQQHRKDLEQLTIEEAEATNRATSRDLKKLLARETALTTPTAGPPHLNGCGKEGVAVGVCRALADALGEAD